MSDELMREQVEMELMRLLNGVGVGGNLLAHDDALRAKVEAVEKERDEAIKVKFMAYKEVESALLKLVAMQARKQVK